MGKNSSKEILEVLNEVSKLFNNSPYDQIHSILNITSKVTGCKKVRFYLWNGNGYVCHAAIPKVDESRLVGVEVPELSYVRKVKETGKPIIVKDQFDDRDTVRQMLNQNWFAIIPVKLSNGYGFISIDDEEYKHDGLEDKLKVLTLLVNECFRNAEIKDMLNKISRTDRLTGVYNRLYFDERIHKMITEMVEESKEFWLMLIDVNGLKQVNDTYGHWAGDQLLIGLSTALKHELGPENIARIGGDEFTILMSEPVDWDDVLDKIERIKKRWVILRTDTHTVKIPISFSYGWVRCEKVNGLEGRKLVSDPKEMERYITKLITMADNRMYKDKKNSLSLETEIK